MNAPALSPLLASAPVVQAPVLQGTALARARLYHLLELALAHPDEAGTAFFADPATERAFAALLEEVTDDPAARDAIASAMMQFTTGLRSRDSATVEADYIGLFAANYPIIPCPPYGSLYTTEDAKRLDEIMEIKAFFARQGVDMAADFDEMPDHICVELELMQVLSFREHEGIETGDIVAVEAARDAAARFLDRFLIPFAGTIARRAAVIDEAGLYSPLLEVVRLVAADHRAALAARFATMPALEMPS